MSREKPESGMDYLKAHPPLFGGLASFAIAYPQIADVQLEIEAIGYSGVASSNRVRRFSTPLNEIVDCVNPCCVHGGFRIGAHLRQMVNDRLTVLQTEPVMCCGHEGSPKGKRVGRDCTNFFKASFKVSYHGETK